MTTDPTQQTRARNLARLMRQHGDERSDETDGTNPELARFILVERNAGGSTPPRYYTDHPTAHHAANYNVTQEYASDWYAEGLADLDLGTFQPLQGVTVTAAVFDLAGDVTPLDAPDEDEYGNGADTLAAALDRIAVIAAGAQRDGLAAVADLAAIRLVLAETGRVTP